MLAVRHFSMTPWVGLVSQECPLVGRGATIRAEGSPPVSYGRGSLYAWFLLVFRRRPLVVLAPPDGLLWYEHVGSA